MKSDSYARFLRSNAYQDLLLAKKKVSLGRAGLPFLALLTLACCLLLESNENIIPWVLFIFSFLPSLLYLLPLHGKTSRIVTTPAHPQGPGYSILSPCPHNLDLRVLPTAGSVTKY